MKHLRQLLLSMPTIGGAFGHLEIKREFALPPSLESRTMPSCDTTTSVQIDRRACYLHKNQKGARMNKNRVEAFSDGVFAIVITLLILDIHLPFGTPPEQLGTALYRLLPSLGAYVLSFFVVGLYWAVHHRHMHRMKAVNSPMLWLNLVWLMCISVMPFPTSLIGGYPLQVLPIVIYGVNLILANVVGFVITAYAHRHPELMSEPVTDKELAYLVPRYIIPNGLYLAGIAMAWFVPLGSYVIFLMVLGWLTYQYSVDRNYQHHLTEISTT